ncbi:hypothetical protein Poli38472_012732 [Pythium oligandrum]|uniref:Aminoglycoside phosphotransferase domain-containing protein n=1 Tax=Pythium oligandrum TaxID=41045 RepID=A0A8K1CET9_PYTOL|nr:hypothetical protein Poli38472_012732 [Pythium oligandrum]|eukprot:TMW61541.1 hypothetical protein Poli38472_012732 [Pythium oligandrum]
MEPRRPKHKQQPPLVVTQSELEHALQCPETYHGLAPDDVSPIEVIHTHLSMVFRLPTRVYKLKKTVDFGFVDFSTLYKRFQACFAEVQLNQRLAPNVYVGVVPVSMRRESRAITVRCDDFWTPEKNNNLDYWLNDEYGEIVEWAVHMVRLPDDKTLLYAMQNGQLTKETLTRVAEKLVAFHRDARRGPTIDSFGKETVIRRNIDENFEQTSSHVNETVSDTVYTRVKTLTYERLKELQATIASRVENRYTCDSHGDLRLEHIYLLDADEPFASLKRTPLRLVVLDCIEFNEQFRYGDPLSDVAFLMMDIWRMGRPDLARYLRQQYLFQATQDTPENEQLLNFYAAYRAVVRAKVSGFRVQDTALDAEHRERERQRARCYWLVALSMLAPPASRPCLMLVGGLPASGKSTLARMLAGDESNVVWLRADAIRKELVGRRTSEFEARQAELEATGVNPGQVEEEATVVKGGSFEEGIYAPNVTERTYDEICIRSIGHVREGERVVVDATFRDPLQRQRFIATAREEGALFAFVFCECDREIIKGRMLARKNDISDATWEVYEVMEAKWNIEDVVDMEECFVVNTEKEKELTLRRTNAFLRKVRLL